METVGADNAADADVSEGSRRLELFCPMEGINGGMKRWLLNRIYDKGDNGNITQSLAGNADYCTVVDRILVVVFLHSEFAVLNSV